VGGVFLGIVVIAGLIGVACWERRGGHVPDVPELQLPAHGLTAVFVGLLLVAIAASIVAIDLSLVWLRAQ